MAEKEVKRKTSTVKKKNGSTKVETEFETYKKSKSKKAAADFNEELEAFEESERRRNATFEETRQGGKVRDEIIIISCALISILLILGNYDCLGIIEIPFNFILFGLMGFFEYFFPFAFFIAAVYLVKNRRNTVARRKITVCAIAIICICALIHIATGNYKAGLIESFFKIGFKAKRGGGLLGDIVASPLCALFKEVATIIILAFILVICFMLITGKAVLSLIGQKSKDEYKKAQTNIQRRQEEKRKNVNHYKKENDYYYGYTGNTPGRQEEAKNKIYAAPVGNQSYTTNDYASEYVPKRTNRESFINRLKGQGAENLTKPGNLGANKNNGQTPSGVNNRQTPSGGRNLSDISFGTKNLEKDTYVPAKSPEIDMVEISGTSENFTSNTSEIYKQEMQRKFGAAGGMGSYNTAVCTGSDGYDTAGSRAADNVAKDDYYVDNDNIPAKAAKPVNENSSYQAKPSMPAADDSFNVSDSSDLEPSNKSAAEIVNPAGNFGVSTDNQDRYKASGVFARGDLVSSKAPESHSLRGKQGEASVTPVDNAVGSAARQRAPKPVKPYRFPPVNLLKPQSAAGKGTSPQELKETARKLQLTLKSFGVNVTILDITCGPSVTQFELQPEIGVKVSKITSLTDDIKLALAAADIRIEAPIPGKSAIGIEVPNKEAQMVCLSSIFQSQEFKNSKASLAFAVGKDIRGNIIVGDIKKMPHLLVAGTTGSGKSVCLNSLILSIIYKYSPENVKMILIDPKMVEFIKYNDVPHLLTPVVNNAQKAAKVLNWAVAEMMKRYDLFAHIGVKDIESYNEKIKGEQLTDKDGCILEKMPKIVIVIDELADLMMVAAKEVEDSICRIAQLARACGIHLVVATQRPTADVVTGLIKANIPSRIALKVASGIDSRTMIDQTGAEKLIGYGDMLYFPTGAAKPVRLQGPYVSDQEIENVVDFLKKNSEASYDEEVVESINRAETSQSSGQKGGQEVPESEYDEYLYQAGCFIIEKQKSSIGALQRQFRIGFNRAARIMDQLSEFGVVGPEEGTKPRQVLMNQQTFDELARSQGFH